MFVGFSDSLSGVDARFIDWSRAGNVLAFRIYAGGSLYQLWTMDVDDPATTLAPLGIEGHSPSWSPDDAAIVFSDFTGPGGWGRILILDLATAQVTTLASRKRLSYGLPCWRPF